MVSIDTILFNLLRLLRRTVPSKFWDYHLFTKIEDTPSGKAPKRPRADGLGPFKWYSTRMKISSGLEMRVHVPDTAPPEKGFPVLLFSHGLGALPNSSKYLETYFASHGYVVIQPRHRGSDWLAVLHRHLLKVFSQKELLFRIDEIRAVLDAIEENEFELALDAERIALAGHSFGALTAQVLAGIGIDYEGVYRNFSDPRIRAFIGLSPFGDAFPNHFLGLHADDYHKLDRPVLFASGENDDLYTLGRGAEVHLTPYKRAATDDKYHLVIAKTRHANFSQKFGWVRPVTKTMLTTTMLAFLDTYLRGDSGAEEYLHNELFEVASSWGCWAFTKRSSK